MKPWAWRAWAPAALAMLALSCAHRHAAKPQELVFWVSWPVSAIESLARRFERENPGFQVSLVQLPWTTGGDSVAAAVKAGAPPDLCQLHCTQVPPFLVNNSLSDWSAGVADLRPGLRGWEMCTLGDAIYGLPWLVRTQVLYWNKSLFARAGLDSTHAPATWDEVQAAAIRIHRMHGGPPGYGLPGGAGENPLEMLLPFVSPGSDSTWRNPDLPPFDAPLFAGTLVFLRSLRAVGVLASQDSLEREFVLGGLGMLLASADLAVRIGRTAPTLAFGMALVPRTAPDWNRRLAPAGGEVLVSFTDSRRKEAALRFARFLVLPENAHALATALQLMQPANLGADTTAWYRARPEQELFFRQYETARFIPNFRGRIELEDTLTTLLGDALEGRRSAEEVAAMVDTFNIKRLGSR